MDAANSCAGNPDPSPNYWEGSACQGLLVEFLEGSPGASSSFPHPFGDFSAGAAFPKAVKTKDGIPWGCEEQFCSPGH